MPGKEMQPRLECGKGVDAGQPEAQLARYYATYAEMLARRAMRFTHDRDIADDMVQETFIRAWALNAFDDGRQPRPAWLLRVCERLCLDALRRESYRRTGDEAAARSLFASRVAHELDCGNEDEYTDYLDAATNVIVALPARKREIAILHFFLGWPAADIAMRLGVKPRSVWTRLYEVRALLRRSLSPERCDFPQLSAEDELARRARMRRWGEALLAESSAPADNTRSV
jgi:RNA polymerase sigma-70 factor (ECF subfamily)